MPVFFLLLILFPFFQENHQNLYGSYRLEDQGVILELSPPNNYTLFVVERDKRSGMVTSKELSRGTFATQGKTVALSGQMQPEPMTLVAVEADKLQINQLIGLKAGAEFLRWSGYHENGKVKFEGSWRKGKKHGEWVYFNEEGEMLKKEMYKRGKLKN